jgi:hypothetical protein
MTSGTVGQEAMLWVLDSDAVEVAHKVLLIRHHLLVIEEDSTSSFQYTLHDMSPTTESTTMDS